MSKHMEELLAEMQKQNNEFNALDDLSKAHSELCRTPPVDGDYGRVRDKYEKRLEAFVKAMRANSRFREGNRYGIVVA